MKAEEIIKQAENNIDLVNDEYYLELKEENQGYAYAYKQGKIAMNLAMQIESLTKKLNKYEKDI